MTNARRGLMFVLSSPSGAGKTTLSRMLLKNEAARSSKSMVMSVSVTTRAPRPGEVDGEHYFFIDQEKFNEMAVNKELLEYARVFDYHYGTPAHFVQEHLDQGIDVLFDIDWQGTKQLVGMRREDVVSVFILPPSMSELERRLSTRAQDSAEVVKKRMSKAADEISHWQEYDYVLVNEDVDTTLANIIKILEAERLKRIRQPMLDGFVSKLCK